MTTRQSGFMGVDPGAVEALLRHAAKELVLPRFEALRDHEIIEKRPGDVVTVADLDSEHFLTEELPKLLPGSLVVGEEAHTKEPEILRRFDGDAPVWLIDPVDGTRNFTNGDPMFCMMVALVIDNLPIGAWIHDPLGGWTVVAEEGGGAWQDGKRLTVPDPPEIFDWVGMLNSWYFEEPRRSELRAETRQLFGTIKSLSCAGHDLVAQARGKRHFAFYRRLWPWDHAPGTLILREAGGEADTVEGSPYRAGDRVHGLLTAPSEAHWRDLRTWLLGKGGRKNVEEGPPGPE